MNKRKMIIFIVIVILVIILIPIILFARKVILFQNLKDKLSSRSPYYYYKYESDALEMNDDNTYEYWIYPNNNSIYNRKNFRQIIYDDTLYLLNKKDKSYVMMEDINDEVLPKIDINMFLPGEDYTLDSSAFELALNMKIENCTVDNKECYKITYKDSQYTWTTYIDKNSFDLVKIHNYNESNELEEVFEWELLNNENLSIEDVNEELSEYKEVTSEEFSQTVEY